MNWLKHHWFGTISGLIVFLFLLMFVLILLSPRQDAAGRGFIPCTKTMAETMLACEESKTTCILGAIAANTGCQAKVIGQGFSDWLKGKQPRPWSNYIFVPEAPVDEDFGAKEREEYFKNNPAAEVEMLQLQQLNEVLENEQPPADVHEDEKPN